MNPVDAAVSEHEKHWKLENQVPPAICINVHVQLRVSADFGKEKGRCEYGHDWKRAHGLDNLLTHLVLQELRMFECVLVEDKDIRYGCKEKIDYQSEDPANI